MNTSHSLSVEKASRLLRSTPDVTSQNRPLAASIPTAVAEAARARFADLTRGHAERLQTVSKHSDFWDDSWAPLQPLSGRKALPLLTLGGLLVAGGGYGVAGLGTVSPGPDVSPVASALETVAVATPCLAIIFAGLLMLALTAAAVFNVGADAPKVPQSVEDWHRDIKAAPAKLRRLGVLESHIAEVEERSLAADRLRETLGAVFATSRAPELHEHLVLVELRDIAAEVGAFTDVAREQHAAVEAAVTRHASRRPLADVAADHVAETSASVELLTAT